MITACVYGVRRASIFKVDLKMLCVGRHDHPSYCLLKRPSDNSQEERRNYHDLAVFINVKEAC